METTTTTHNAKTTGKPAGIILFAIVVIAAVLICITAVGDVTANKVDAGTASMNATRAARCGMDERTFMQMAPSFQMGLNEQCNSPAELQP